MSTMPCNDWVSLKPRPPPPSAKIFKNVVLYSPDPPFLFGKGGLVWNDSWIHWRGGNQRAGERETTFQLPPTHQVETHTKSDTHKFRVDPPTSENKGSD